MTKDIHSISDYPTLFSIVLILDQCSAEHGQCQACEYLASCCRWWDSLVDIIEDKDIDQNLITKKINEIPEPVNKTILSTKNSDKLSFYNESRLKITEVYFSVIKNR
jgi:hypothetical protein